MGERYDPMAAYLANGVLEEFRTMTNEWLKFQKELFKYESKTGEIRQVDLLKEFRMSSDTLKKWRENGLPSINRGGSVFYLLEDLHNFYY
ncbi:transcriptional regulator [Lactococcus lactis]|uniref:transcriptional regulator n=1 Tax=Lactococcus lactis TaxID=1358 RepID=UPI0022E57A61|nr:transcriptional regulator [Lactococcus lactis]MDT2895831.1 transcriptional regulator [Lactococcus lactis]